LFAEQRGDRRHAISTAFFLEQLPDRRIYFWRELSLAKEKDAVAVKAEAERMVGSSSA
jgi:hypothetical protein